MSIVWFATRLRAVVGPNGISLVALAVVLLIAMRAWPACQIVIKRHLQLASAVNFPLFFAFAATDELRNLSFLFVGFVILVAFVIDGNGSVATINYDEGI